MKGIDYFKSLAFSILLLSLSLVTKAQLQINSPYSRFGLGDVDKNENGISRSMGGIAYGLQSPFFINSKNPASYAAIDSGSFVLDAGYSGWLLQTKTDISERKTNYFNLDYLKVAFPVVNWWRVSFSLSPYTTVGYNVVSNSYVDSVGDVKYSYSGDGGVNQLIFGNAFRIGKKLAVGFNMSYLFGNINYKKISSIPDNINMYTFRLTNTVNMSQLYYDFGVQFTDSLGKENEYYYTLGGVFSNKQTLVGTSTTLAETYISSESGFEYIKDTVVNSDNGRGNVIIPMFYGLGFQFHKGMDWSFGMDFNYQKWEEFSAFGRQDSFKNSFSFNLGGMYRVKRIMLRGGLRYYNSYLTLKNHNINELGITFGCSIPLRIDKQYKTFPYLDLGTEIGRRGTTADGLIQQNYVKFFLGLTIRNGWFEKRRYN